MTWTQPVLWIQVLRKAWQVHFSWQAQDVANFVVSDFAKASAIGKIHFSWQAQEGCCESINGWEPYHGAMWHLCCKHSEDVFLCMPNITDFLVY